MTEILKELELAYRMISMISVSGDSVDNMAAARSKLRSIYAELEKMESENQLTSESQLEE